MKFRFSCKVYTLPICDADISLRQRIDLERAFYLDLQKRAKDLDREDLNFDLDLIQLTADNAVKSFCFFTKIDEAIVKARFDISQLITYFNSTLSPVFNALPESLESEMMIGNDRYFLPNPEVNAECEISFDEFILAKEICRQLSFAGSSYVESWPYLAAIFLRKDKEPFDKKLISESFARLEFMRSLPLDKAKQVALFFERLNVYIFDHFSVFGKAKGKQPNFSKHFDKWGWQSFLTYIAEAGIFTIPGSGKNAIDCAKISKLYDVLSYSSEKKDHEEILAAWQDSQQ